MWLRAQAHGHPHMRTRAPVLAQPNVGRRHQLIVVAMAIVIEGNQALGAHHDRAVQGAVQRAQATRRPCASQGRLRAVQRLTMRVPKQVTYNVTA